MPVYHQGMTLKVTCRLTACTLGSALGPTLCNEYGRTLPLPYGAEAFDHKRFPVDTVTCPFRVIKIDI